MPWSALAKVRRHARGKSRGLMIGTASAALAVLAFAHASEGAPGRGIRAASGGPLRLSAVGSFFVGGRAKPMSEAEVGIYGSGPVIVDQMYVQYMVPAGTTQPPFVMIHGSTLTGKSYETTPDGRMGWYEYFARLGFPSYVVDQVGRGRSGFDQAPFNDVRAGSAAPTSQPAMRRAAMNIAWTRFRFGPTAGVRFEDSQFPTDAALDLSKQGVPDISPTAASDEANFAALVELTVRLKRSVLIAHSQSGRFPFEALLRGASGVLAVVALEPAGCNAKSYSDVQISRLAKVPILVVFGDHVDMQQPVGPSWQPFLEDCRAFVSRVNASGGRATMLHLPEAGIRGNSHMMMQDRNNLRIADLIAAWFSQTRRDRPGG